MSGYGIFSDFYDGLTANVSYDEMWDFYRGLLVSCGIKDGILLDLACGTGSLSERMSDSGYDVIAVDGSVEMLSRAREKMWEKGVAQNILFLCQDMREIDLYGTVRGTVCALDSLNHLDSIEDFEATVKRVSLFTEKGGVFLFDVNTLYKHRNVLADNTFVYDTDDVYCVWQNELSDDGCTVEINLDFFEYTDGVYERYGEAFSERAYDLEAITDILKKNGFTVKKIYDGFSEREVSSESERAVFLSVKE